MSSTTIEQIEGALRSINDAANQTDIVSSGLVSGITIEGEDVTLSLNVTPEMGERVHDLRTMVERVVNDVSGVSRTTVTLAGGDASPGIGIQDKYQMDGHKMLWHLERVAAWQRGERVAPIHIDVGLSKGCNIRCHYCYGVTQGNFFRKGADRYFPGDALLSYMRDAGEIGVRSMALIGEAEPLLNPHVYDAIREGRNAGVDIALGTNGLLLDTGRDGEEALENLIWIRFNISAATDYAYRRIHASKDFEVAKDKIRFCVDTKRKKNLDTTVGLQMVLTPKNVDQVVPLAELGAELGVDYLVVKQCSDTVDSDIGVYDQLEVYHNYTEQLEEAEAVSNDDYQVIIKWGKIMNEGKRDYDRCLGAPFLLYSGGDGRIYPCGQWFDSHEEEYRLGDLTEMSFKEIFESDRYWDVIRKQSCDVDVHKCYSNCRTNAINEFLWTFREAPAHVNFV